MNKREMKEKLQKSWQQDARWQGIVRPYSAEQVVELMPSLRIEHSLARHGAEQFWQRLSKGQLTCALGCLTGNQAIQAIQAGLDAIYCSGWQVAGDNNSAREVYPDQSLYPVNSVPNLVEAINHALRRADETTQVKGEQSTNWYAPIIADAEAGFGGNLNAYELMKALINAGAAAVHFEDQLSSAKKCGHMGGKVLVPTQEAANKLIAARLAADVEDVPTLIIGRTDANAASLITSDNDDNDRPFLTGTRTIEGFYAVKPGLEQAISRGLAYAPHADLIWCETSKPDMGAAREFAAAIHAKYPGKFLCYNCSPSFNWRANLTEQEMLNFREKLFEMGYVYQFITLVGWHALNLSMFEIASAYKKEGMFAYSKLQDREEAMEPLGFRARKHQAFVGTEFFDQVQTTIMQGELSTHALKDSTEKEQF